MLAAYVGGVQKPHGKTQRYVMMRITSVQQAYYLKPTAKHYASQKTLLLVNDVMNW
jgi:hypothetical protein